MNPRRFFVSFSVVLVVALVIFQVTRSHSDTTPTNVATDRGDDDTSDKKVADGSSSTSPVGPASVDSGRPSGGGDEEQPLTADDFNKVKVLKEILDSKNDNDPRLDSDFKNLSEGAKKLMRAEYKSLAAEKFNEKGTVVFLLGRNLKTKADFDFVDDVLSEPPCLNLADCSAPAPPPAKGEDAHEDSISSVTLAYPQIVSLKALESFLNAATANPTDGTPAPRVSAETVAWAKHGIEVGTQSKDPSVAQMAQEMRHKINSLGQ